MSETDRTSPGATSGAAEAEAGHAPTSETDRTGPETSSGAAEEEAGRAATSETDRTGPATPAKAETSAPQAEAGPKAEASERARGSSAAAGMPRDQRAYVIAMCAIIGGAFAYAACEWGTWPRLTYLPLRGELTLDPPPGIAMPYIGIVAWGLGGLVCGALAGALLCRLSPRPWPSRALHLFGAWALAALLLAGGYFTWGLWPW